MSEQMTKDAAGKKAGVTLKIDSAALKVAGWAAPRDPGTAGEALHLQLELGSVLLGTIRRDKPRPDVNAHLGHSGGPLGFSVADTGLKTFARLTGLEDLALTANGARALPERSPLGIAEGAASGFLPFGMRQGLGKIVRLVDAWMESSRTLSLRFDGSTEIAKSLDAYQVADGQLIAVAVDQPIHGLTSIATMTLINPFGPVLLVAKSDDRAIDMLDFIPFPSLVRGGQHAAERLIAARGSDELADTASLSAELTQAWLDRLDRPDRCVTSIVLDPTVHTGLEPALNDDLLAWLADALGVTVAASADSVPDFVARALARHGRANGDQGHVLQLPADSIPTISALVRAIPDDARPQLIAGGSGVVQWGRHGKIWSVWQPPLGESLAALQVPGVRRPMPMLDVRGPSGGGRDVALQWPLCLGFQEPPVRVGDSGPFETGADGEGSVLAGAGSAKRTVSVLVLMEAGQGAPIALLESLARQDGVQFAHLALCQPLGVKDTKLEKALTRLFPRRHDIVSVPANAGRIEQVVAARGTLASEQIVVVGSGTVLPDARTLATLLHMLDVPDVASTGCMVRAANDKMTPLSAGYSLTGVELRAAPAIAFDPIDPELWRTPATYPVVANTLSALVVRRDLLGSLSASGSSRLRPEGDDLLLGIHLIEAGGINLCTTAVSVYSAAAAPRRSQMAVSVPYRLSPQSLAQIAQSAVLVQRVA